MLLKNNGEFNYRFYVLGEQYNLASGQEMTFADNFISEIEKLVDQNDFLEMDICDCSGGGGGQGPQGEPGESAYQIALDQGFVGTEAEWLESLKASLDSDDLQALIETKTVWEFPSILKVGSDGVSAIQARGTWNKFLFLFDASSTVDVTNNNGQPQLMGELGRVGLTDGFTYIRNCNAGNTTEDVIDPENGHFRFYDDGLFRAGGSNTNIELDPENASIHALVNGEAYTINIIDHINEIIDLKNTVISLNSRIAALENPIVNDIAVTPISGPMTIGAGEGLTVTVSPDGQDFYSLEVDHSLQGILPEFSLYASEANPFGSEQARTQAEGLGFSATYSEDDKTWEMNFGPDIVDTFRQQSEVRFYFVVKDSLGNDVWGSMNPTTPENTRIYQIS